MSTGIRDQSRFAVAALGYVALTLVLLRPITSHFATQVPHDLGDPLLSTTLLWWNAHTAPLTDHWWNGSFFAPASGVLSFSDHRLGESLIASPLMWAGVSPVAAYNITLLLTFPLCAIAAHALAFVITRRHDAGVIAGLAYGFNPYRLAHLEHLELLASYGMPAALAALHLALTDGRWRWPALFAAAILLQALCCSYYAAFFFVMLGLWAAWFIRRENLALASRFMAALAAVMLLLAPVAWSYRSIHQHYGFSRGLNDIVTLSADVTSYVTASPLVWLWRWTAALNGPERQLMPGAALVVVTLAGVWVAWRSRTVPATGRASVALTLLALVFAAVAVYTALSGPWRLGVGGLEVSGETVFKPLSLTLVALTAAAAVSPIARDAYRRRSSFAFYLIAAVVLGLCSLGPKPAFLGHQFLYEPPYAWLMRITWFGESIRVPARFAMLVILSLSTATAIAFAHLGRRRVRGAVLAAAAVAIAMEGWSADIPMFDPPRPWPDAIRSVGAASVLHLPIGEVTHDVAAMFRATRAGLLSVNGYSGYQPPHYEALRFALEERDETALQALAERGPLLVGVDRRADDASKEIEWLTGVGSDASIPDANTAWFVIPSTPAAAASCDQPVLAVASVRDRHGEVALPWVSMRAQRRGQSLTIDLGRPVRVCAVHLSLGPHAALYPRLLSVATSSDGTSWQTSLTEKTGGRAVAGALARPRDPELVFPIHADAARFVRLQLEADRPDIPWAVTAIAVNGSPLE